MSLFMKYDIVQMSAPASHVGTDPSSPIFNDSAAKIQLNLKDSQSYIHFKGMLIDFGLLAYALDFRKPHKK